MWTPQLKKDAGVVDADDGMFYMDINDYQKIFAVTSICMTNDPSIYKHSSYYHSMLTSSSAFFKFSLTKDIDCTKTCFGISIAQQGQRLMRYRAE